MATSAVTKGLTGCLVVGVFLIAAAMIVGYFAGQMSDQKAAFEERARLDSMTPQQRAEEEARLVNERKRLADEAAREQWLTTAKGACLLSIQKQLNDPYSAKFDPTTSWAAEVGKNNRTRVQPKFRAKNAFGAYIYSTWDCVVEPAGNDVRIVTLKPLR